MQKPNKKLRILILNNYSVSRVSEEVNKGLKPVHHLYGILHLSEAGYETILVNPLKSHLWNFVGKWLNLIPILKISNLELQIGAFKKRKEYDIIYAPCQDVTMLLGILSYLGLFNKKIIAIAHHPFLQGRLLTLKKLLLHIPIAGHARWGTLSNKVANDIYQISKRCNPVCMHWGPEIKYYDRIVEKYKYIDPEKETDIISIGRNSRDHQVLIDAFAGTSVKVKIYCSKDVGNTLSKKLTANISVKLLEDSESLKFPDIINIYKKSKIMAIPMFAQKWLCGLTSITDALALGMPILITRNDFIEIDVEKEGVGYWINASDPNEWREKVYKLLSSDNLLQEMSVKSRLLAEKKFNDNIYFDELLEMIKSVV